MEEIIARIVHLNNKNRKGPHVYIKEKGKPPRYYKYHSEANLDVYIERYKAGKSISQRFGDKKRLNTKEFIKAKLGEEQNKTAQRIRQEYRIRLKKAPKVPDVFGEKEYRRAIETTIPEIALAKNEIYDKLLSGAIKDKQLMGTVIKGNEQWKHLITYEITVKGKEQNTGDITELARIKDLSGKTLDQIETLYGPYLKEGVLLTSTMLKNLKEELGYTDLNFSKRGTITETRVRMTFRN